MCSKHKNMAMALFLLVMVLSAGCHAGRTWGRVAESDMASILGLYEPAAQMRQIEELTSPKFAGRKACTEGEDKAGDYLVGALEDLGLEAWAGAGFDSYRHSFKWPGWPQPAENIIAVLPGQELDQYLLIGAHYDHLGLSEEGGYYPGADDNAVGTAAVLELARCFKESGLTTRRTIVFVLFSAEERGLVGSQELVNHLKHRKLDDNVIMLNLDVIAGVSGDELVVFDNGKQKLNSVLAERAVQEIEQTGLKASVQSSLPGGVDSMRFTEHGIPAITLLWDDLRADHPHLHKTTDTYENLNPEIVEKATRAAIRVAWALAFR